jgi:cytochrome c553
MTYQINMPHAIDTIFKSFNQFNLSAIWMIACSILCVIYIFMARFLWLQQKNNYILSSKSLKKITFLNLAKYFCNYVQLNAKKVPLGVIIVLFSNQLAIAQVQTQAQTDLVNLNMPKNASTTQAQASSPAIQATAASPVQSQNKTIASSAVHLGEHLSLACMSCHNQSSFYPIAGQNPQLLFEKINRFATDQDQKTIMHQLLKGYNAQELKAIADYFAQQKPYSYLDGEKDFAALQKFTRLSDLQKNKSTPKKNNKIKSYSYKNN